MSQKIYTDLDVKSSVTISTINNATTDTDKFLVSDGGIIKYRTGAELLSDIGITGGYVPYTGATGNVDLGTHTLSSYNLIVNHTSGSGVAASITKGGSGEALTINKTSGSGNAMSVTGGLTSLVDLTLSSIPNATTDTDRFIVSDSGTIKYRTGAQVLSDIGGQATLTNPITGTGTTNYLSKFTGTTSLGNSQIFDNGTNVGIGTTSPSAKLHLLQPNTFNTADIFSIQHNFLFGNLILTANDFVVKSTGNVGINTASPGYKLHVNGTLRSSNITIADYIIHDGDTNTYMGFPSTDTISWNTNGSERMRINSLGNVGIGASSPSALLHIGQSNTTSDALMRLGVAYNANRTSRGGITWHDAANVTGKIYTEYDGTMVSMVFGSLYNSGYNSDPLMTIRGNGNVGIGTSSPVAKLDIGGASGEMIRLADSSTIGNPFISFFQTSTRRSYIQHVDSGDNLTLASEYGGIVLMTGTSGTETEKMRITSSGEVGIGTSILGAPSYGSTPQLTVASPTGGVMDLRSSDTDIVANDRFGRLQFSGKDDNSVAYATAAIEAIAASTTGSGSGGGGVLKFMTATPGVPNSPLERMRITSGGMVGIGTTEPSYPLDVNGTAMLRSALYMTAGGTSPVPNWYFQINGSGDLVVDEAVTTQNFIFSNSGQVLIGTTVGGTPAYGSAPQFVTASATGGVIDIRSLNTNIVANSLLGRIQFTGKDDSTVGYTSAAIEAVSAGTTNSGFNGGGTLKFMTSSQGYSTNPLPRMWISYLGYVTIGSTNTNSYPLRVTTQVSNTSIYADYDIVAYSDQSVKENIRPIENVIERVQKSRGVLYDRIDSESKDNIGFIAQELEVAFPELVVTNEDGTKAVKYQNAVAVMFEAIKEQQKQIDELKELITKLIK
jgi:hypothetical protein